MMMYVHDDDVFYDDDDLYDDNMFCLDVVHNRNSLALICELLMMWRCVYTWWVSLHTCI